MSAQRLPSGAVQSEIFPEFYTGDMEKKHPGFPQDHDLLIGDCSHQGWWKVSGDLLRPAKNGDDHRWQPLARKTTSCGLDLVPLKAIQSQRQNGPLRGWGELVRFEAVPPMVRNIGNGRRPLWIMLEHHLNHVRYIRTILFNQVQHGPRVGRDACIFRQIHLRT